MSNQSSLTDALELLVPPFGDEPEAWNDVLRRAERDVASVARPSKRLVLLAATLLVAVALVASAYAVGRHFLVGDAAPPEVTREAALLPIVKGELIPQAQGEANVLIDRTYAGAVLHASTGDVYLWVAPTSDGSECRFLHVVGTELSDGRPNLSGGCGYRPSPLNAVSSLDDVRGRKLRLLSGAVSDTVVRLEITYPDGQTELAPVTDGYFLFEVRDLPVSVAALDETGRVLARQRFLPTPVYPRPIGSAKTLISTRTQDGEELSLSVTRGSGGTSCVEIRTPGGLSSGCAAWNLDPTEIAVQPMQVGAAPGGLFLLEGKVGSAIASLALRFEDGKTVRLPLVEGWTLYQVTREHFAKGRRPELLVGRDRDGRVISRERLGPWAH